MFSDFDWYAACNLTKNLDDLVILDQNMIYCVSAEYVFEEWFLNHLQKAVSIRRQFSTYSVNESHTAQVRDFFWTMVR